MQLRRRLLASFAAAMLVALAIGPGTALALDENHGIGLSKGCIGSTKIGDAYRCSFAITNSIGIDEAGDTLTVTSLIDTVNRPGSPTSGNILQIPGIAGNVTFEPMPGIWRMLPDDGEPGRLTVSMSDVTVSVSPASSIPMLLVIA